MKLKSHSGASKRFHKTGTGKFMRKKAGKRHILTGKNRERKRRRSAFSAKAVASLRSAGSIADHALRK